MDSSACSLRETWVKKKKTEDILLTHDITAFVIDMKISSHVFLAFL